MNFQVICPVLRSHVCEVCCATGDDAHTKNYCPLIRDPSKPVNSLHSAIKVTSFCTVTLGFLSTSILLFFRFSSTHGLKPCEPIACS